MSNEEKRSGIRDIRTLRERLGKVKKTTTSSDSASQPSDGLIAPTPQSPSRDRTSPAVFDQTVDQSESSLGQNAATQTPQPEGGTTENASAEAQFAHPLQVGSYAQAVESNPLTEADLAELEEYERKHSGRMKTLLSVGGALLALGLLFGYLSGSTMDARHRHNFAVRTAKSVTSDLEVTFTNITQVQEALDGEVKRLEGLQGKLTAQLRKIKDAKISKNAEAAQAAKSTALGIKAAIDRGVDFSLVASKMPEELSVSTESLLRNSHALPTAIRTQLGKFLIETDRYFRSVGVFQKTAKAIGRINEVAKKRFGPVLAIDTSAGQKSASFQRLPSNLQTGQFMRFNRDFVNALNEADGKRMKTANDIALFGLAVPDDGASSKVATKRIIAVDTEAAVNVSAHVYPAIRQVLMVQFQELEELGKSLNSSRDALKGILEEVAKQDVKFTL